MALKSTIYKTNIHIANIDVGYYQEHAFTIARHPSETDERMMIRLLAMSMQAHLLRDVCNGDGILAFGAGISDINEPDLWLKDFTDQIQLWVDVGQPDEKRIVKACARANKVIVYPYHHAALVWFRAIENKLSRLKNLEIYQISEEQSLQLSLLAEHTMQLQVTIQEGNCLVNCGDKSVEINFQRLF